MLRTDHWVGFLWALPSGLQQTEQKASPQSSRQPRVSPRSFISSNTSLGLCVCVPSQRAADLLQEREITRVEEREKNLREPLLLTEQR